MYATHTRPNDAQQNTYSAGAAVQLPNHTPAVGCARGSSILPRCKPRTHAVPHHSQRAHYQNSAATNKPCCLCGGLIPQRIRLVPAGTWGPPTASNATTNVSRVPLTHVRSIQCSQMYRVIPAHSHCALCILPGLANCTNLSCLHSTAGSWTLGSTTVVVYPHLAQRCSVGQPGRCCTRYCVSTPSRRGNMLHDTCVRLPKAHFARA
jgi:hypothetical protein